MARQQRVPRAERHGQREPEQDQHDAVVVHERGERAQVDAGPGRVDRLLHARTSAPTDTPGANDACIDVTCSGLDNRSCGYESSASLTLSAGTVEPSIASPSSPAAVISRQPIVSASLSSRYAIRPVAVDVGGEQPLEPEDREAALAVAQTRVGGAHLERDRVRRRPSA